jgi:hypothetical protein
MLAHVNLDDLRQSIVQHRRITFYYEGKQLSAEPYLLGLARKTNALVLSAWVCGPEEGWRHFRFSMMRSMHECGSIDYLRADFDFMDPVFQSVDTHALQLPRPRAMSRSAVSARWRPWRTRRVSSGMSRG